MYASKFVMTSNSTIPSIAKVITIHYLPNHRKTIDELKGCRVLTVVTVISGLFHLFLINITRYFGVSLLSVLFYKEVERGMKYLICLPRWHT